MKSRTARDEIPLRPECAGRRWRRTHDRCLSADQQPILDRDDVLVYRGDVRTAPLCVMGDILLDLVVTGSAMDTDFIAKFSVEDTGGAITVLTIGSLAASFASPGAIPSRVYPRHPRPSKSTLARRPMPYPVGSRPTPLIMSSEYPPFFPTQTQWPRPGTKPTRWLRATPYGTGQTNSHESSYR